MLRPWQRRLEQLNLQEHEDKLLLLLALVISAVVGLVVVAFVAMTERLGKTLLTAGPAQRLLSPFIGSLIGGWLLYRFFPEARGSGIPQTRVALVLKKGVIGMRTVIGKFLCSSISLGSGVALGREGPSVHIGAGIASMAGRKLGLSEEHVKSLIPVGTAAAVAAAFNTPLAAVLFTLEEILADLHARVVGAVVIGAATSWMILRLILGDEPLFHVPAYQLVHPLEFVVYALLGVLGGLVSTVFVKMLLSIRKAFQKTPAAWAPFAPAAGGLTVGLLALAVPGVLGVGYNLVGEALNGQLAWKVMLLLLVLKIIATSTSYSSGNAGGIFGPSLFIGAMLGGTVGQIAHTLAPDHTGNAGAYALVGMGAAFAGIVRTPMTSVIMIFEVTRDYTIIVPLMIANLCSYLLASKLQHLPIYEALSRQDGIVMPSPEHRLEPLTVEGAMQPAPPRSEAPALHVHPDDLLDTALQKMGREAVEEIPVISRAGGEVVGRLTIQEALAAYGRKPEAARRPVSNWLPAVGAIAAAAVLLFSGLLFWQRQKRHEFGSEAYQDGQRLMKQGQVSEAVLAYRSALAQTPQDSRTRAALGLALVRIGQFDEAHIYLSEAARALPQSGPVYQGLAQVAAAAGRQAEAVPLLRQALAKEWSDDEEPQRREAQLEFASLLTEAGHPSEATSVLLAVIAQRGDDPVTGKRAAQMLVRCSSTEQVEEAYRILASHFPADGGIWLALGDTRLSEDKVLLALEAYRRAARAAPGNELVRIATARAEEILKLDPGRKGLSVRERARRWDEVLQRVATAAGDCGASPELAQARSLLKVPANSLEVSDRKMDAALALWKKLPESCAIDPVLRHILAKVTE
ncbi:MAG: tetratricopeptide repeat protein [Acidobacteria bacterium]|nr:tetratricopeptide repeat protein [Acidobacteriota bacterium]